MRRDKEIQAALSNVDAVGQSRYAGMTYEQGIDEALRWVLEEISNEDFEYAEKE
jgi:hypothetical protein